MKRTSSVGPLLLILSACSSGSHGQPATGDAGGATADTDAMAPGDDAGDGTIAYEAVLTGAEVSPSPVRTTASGRAAFVLSADGMTLTYNISFTPPDFTPSAVNLHLGAVG